MFFLFNTDRDYLRANSAQQILNPHCLILYPEGAGICKVSAPFFNLLSQGLTRTLFHFRNFNPLQTSFITSHGLASIANAIR